MTAVVNARTGQVQGERPWSWPKILAAAVLAALLLTLIFALLADGGLIDQVLRQLR